MDPEPAPVVSLAYDRDLVRYLCVTCKGRDVTRFWTLQGEPDIQAAQRYVDTLRARLEGTQQKGIDIDRDANTVRVSVSLTV